MAARIRSFRNFLTPIDEASRDDLVLTDVVSLISIDTATTYAWSVVFIPEGSTASFSGSSTAISPGSFTVDKVGPYLIRLTVDATLPTEDTQYVRLRALTTSLGLKLVAAGERRDGTGIIPVDVDPEGWAYNQNFNLLTLEAAIGSSGQTLAQTLLLGNVTGGKNIVVSAGDVVRAPDATLPNAAGEILHLRSGQGLGTGDGGDVALDPGTSAGSGKRGRALVDGALAFINREAPKTAVNEGAIFVSNGSGGLDTNEPYYRFGSNGIIVPLLGGGHLDYHRDVPEVPGSAVSYEGWLPVAGKLAAIRVFMDTVNTVGTYTLTVTNLATSNPCTATATFNMNSLSAGVVTAVPLTGTLTDLDFNAVDRWEVTLTSNNPGFNGSGIYFELEFLVGYGGINGQDLSTTLGYGNSTGSHDIIMTSGDQILGQQGVALGGTVIIRGGTPTGGVAAGGDVRLRPGAGVGGGNDGIIQLRNAAGTNSVRMQVTGAQQVEIGTTLPLVYNGVTGKLTVPGIIDPTAVVFDYAAEPTTGVGEGAVFVSDGTGGLTLGHLYFRPASNGVAVDLQSGGASSLATVLTVGNSTGGTNIEMTSGDVIIGEGASGLAGTVTLRGGTATGGGATNGGNVRLRPGAGFGGGSDGYLHLQNASASQGVRISVSAADTFKIDSNAGGGLPLLYNASTGKLDVPGLIDPTGVVFTEAGAPATTASEGAVFVSDGTGGLSAGHLYFQPPSDGTPIDISAPSGGAVIDYYVDQGLSPGTYGTIADALLAASETGILRIVLWLTGGQTHTWDGTNGDTFFAIHFRGGPTAGATYLFDEGTGPSFDIDFIFEDLALDCSEGQAWASSTTTFINCTGNLTAWRPYDNPSATPQTIRMQGCTLTLALQPGGNSPSLAPASFVFEDSTLTKLNSSLINSDASNGTAYTAVFRDSTVIADRGTVFNASGTDTLDFTFEHSVVQATVTANAVVMASSTVTGTWVDSQVIVTGGVAHTFTFGSAQTQQGSTLVLPLGAPWPTDTPSLPKQDGVSFDLNPVVWSGVTTDDTPTEVFVYGVVNSRFVLSNNMSLKFTIEIVALNTLTGDTAGFKRSGVIKRRAGAATTAIVGVTLDEDTAADTALATADVTATADTTNGSLKITVTGILASNVQWVARMTDATMTG